VPPDGLRTEDAWIVILLGYFVTVTVSCHIICAGPCGSPWNGMVWVPITAVPGF